MPSPRTSCITDPVSAFRPALDAQYAPLPAKRVLAGEAADVNGPAPAPPLHHRNRGAAAVGHAGQVRLDRLDPRVDGQLRHRPEAADSGVVDEDVQPPSSSTAAVTRRSASSWRRTSATTVATRPAPGVWTMLPPARSRAISARPNTSTSTPAARNGIAVASPIPRDPPVTIAMRPANDSEYWSVIWPAAVPTSSGWCCPSGPAADRVAGRAADAAAQGGAAMERTPPLPIVKTFVRTKANGPAATLRSTRSGLGWFSASRWRSSDWRTWAIRTRCSTASQRPGSQPACWSLLAFLLTRTPWLVIGLHVVWNLERPSSGRRMTWSSAARRHPRIDGAAPS